MFQLKPYQFVLNAAILTAFMTTNALAAPANEEIDQLRQAAMPQVQDYADGYLFEAPATPEFQLMIVNVYDQAGNEVLSTRSRGEPVEFVIDTLPDGHYRYETVVVSNNPLANPADVAANLADAEIASREFGSFEVKDGERVIRAVPEERSGASLWQSAADQARRMAAHWASWVANEAVAQNIIVESIAPTVAFNDVDDPGPFEFRIINEGDFIGFYDDFDSHYFLTYNSSLTTGVGNASIRINSSGDVGLANFGLFVDRSSNRVGINTTTPSGELDIHDTSPDLRMLDEDNDTEMILNLSGNDMRFWGRPPGATTFTIPFRYQVDAPTNSLTIAADGEVGIGTGSPNADLNIRRDDPSLSFTNTNSGNNDSQTLVFSNNFLRIQGVNGQDIGKLHTLAPVGSFTTDAKGRTGYGTATPDASFNVKYRAAHGAVPIFLAEDNANNEKFSIAPNGTVRVNGSIVHASDANQKTNVVSLDYAEILDKVATLPIQKWQYKDDQGVNHIGPMAQDFYATFGLGDTDKGIATVDSSGVALAAIKALAIENVQLKTRNHRYEARLLELEAKLERMAALESVVAELAADGAEALQLGAR